MCKKYNTSEEPKMGRLSWAHTPSMRNIVKVKAHVCTVRIELKQDTLGFDFIYLHSHCGLDIWLTHWYRLNCVTNSQNLSFHLSNKMQIPLTDVNFIQLFFRVEKENAENNREFYWIEKRQINDETRVSGTKLLKCFQNRAEVEK